MLPEVFPESPVMNKHIVKHPGLASLVASQVRSVVLLCILPVEELG